MTVVAKSATIIAIKAIRFVVVLTYRQVFLCIF